MEYKSLATVIRIFTGLMLICALGSWPYAYYQFLRIVVCGASFFLVWYFNEIQIKSLGWLFIVPGLLFNPIFPVYLDKQLWQTLDVAFGLLFLASLTAKGKKHT